MDQSEYSKIEKGELELSMEILDKIAALFGGTIDQIVHMDGAVPEEVHFEDKTAAEQLRLLQGLPEEDARSSTGSSTRC